MLLVHEILGAGSEPRFASREVDRLLVSSTDAAKRRLRARTEAGTDVAVALERSSYLRHGAVLADDGATIIVVERSPEPAAVIRFGAESSPEALVEGAARVGHAFGNQHVPIEVSGSELRIPVTTSPDVVRGVVEALGLEGVELAFELVQLGRERPLSAAAHHR